MSRVRDALERGDLASAAAWEAAACERDGYGDTAELIERLAAELARVVAETDTLREAAQEVVAAAESLTRPGVVTGSVEEHARAIRMTNAVSALAALAASSTATPQTQ